MTKHRTQPLSFILSGLLGIALLLNPAGAQPAPDAPVRLTDEEDLQDPKFLAALLGEASNKKDLHLRVRDSLLMDFDSGTPYSGWVSESRGDGLALGQYKSGKPEGYLFMWDSKGQIRSWSQNIDGKKQGLWIEWREDGKKKEEINYKNGEPHGRVTLWHTNGHKMSEGFYEEGQKVGVHTEWHRNGNKKLEMKLGQNDSFVRTKWDENGKEASRVKVEEANSATPRKFIWNGKKFVKDLEEETDHLVELPVDARNQSLTQSTGNLDKINIRKSGAYVILGKQVTEEQIKVWLTGELKKKPDLKVLIRADQEAKHLFLANVISICRKVGVPRASIAVKTERSSKSDGNSKPEPEALVQNPEPEAPQKKLTPEELEALLTDEIGTWQVKGHTLQQGIDVETGLAWKPKDSKFTMETRWKEKGKSTSSTFNPVINGKKVPYVATWEYDAKEGVFIWRSKGEGFPEAVENQRYDPEKKIFHGVTRHPNDAIETTTFKIVNKDKRLFSSHVRVDGRIVFSREEVFTRMEEKPEDHALAEFIRNKAIHVEMNDQKVWFRFKNDGSVTIEDESGDTIPMNYMVRGLRVTISKGSGEMVFTFQKPKVIAGDKFIVTIDKGSEGGEARVIKVIATRKLTKKEVADLFAGEIGKWKLTGKRVSEGGTPEPVEDIIETNWKVEGQSTLARGNLSINGKKVPFTWNKEYNAKEGVFILRSKGEGFPETVTSERYDPEKKIYHAQATYPNGAKETTTYEIINKDKRIFKHQVEFEGRVVYSLEFVSTRMDENQPPKPTSNALKKGLVSYYPFNGNAKDEAGNGHDGTVVGAKLTKDRHGKPDSAYQFKLGDHIKIDGLMGKPKNLTLAAWVKLDGQQGRMGSEIISLGDMAVLRVDNKSRFTQRVGTGGVFFGGGKFWIHTMAPVNYRGTGWHQVVFTFDDEANNQVTYVDGEQMASKKNTKSIVYEGGGRDTFIGIHGKKAVINWRSQGIIDDIRIYDRALNTDEVKVLFLTEKPATPLQAGKKIKAGTGTEKTNEALTSSGDLLKGTKWKYDDSGMDPGTEWRGIEFDDAEWDSGPAPLGYGDDDIATGIGFGPDEENKHITSYFRTGFEVPEDRVDSSLRMSLRCDDGAIIYLNGKEVIRYNLPGGNIRHSQSALRIISGNQEKTFRNYNIAATTLRTGNNVLAAEVHQRGRTSSDLIFDLKVFQTGETSPAPVTLAKAITGKRFVCQIDKDQEQSEHSNVLLQFEKDGIFNIAEISEGKISPKDDDLTYSVDGLTARVKKNGEEDGGVTFTSTTPKKGDKISFGGEKHQITATILRIEPAAPLVNTPPKQSKIGLGQMLLELQQPLTDQEKLLVGRWQEFDMEEPDTPLSHWIFRPDRSYTWFIVHPATDNEGNEIAGKTEGHLNHGIWKIDDNRLNHFDLVYNGEKLEEVEAWISELKSLTRDGYRSEETVEGDTTKFRGLPVEKFTAPEMLPYNDAAAFQSFDIRKTYNSAKGKGTEQINIFFSPTPETSKPINPEPAEDPTKPEPKAEAKKPGTVLWEFKTGGQVRSSPAIGLDGTVYFGSWDHKIYALIGKTGAKRWEFETGGPVKSSPAIGSDGTVYVGSLNRKVYALDGRTGVKLWEFETERPVYSSPAIGIGGTVYIGSGDKKLYALDGKTGAKRWEFETGEGISSCPSIGIDGTIYFGSDKIYALDGKTGTKIWEWDAARSVQSSSPAIGADGTLYIGLKDNNVYALDGRTGIKRWEFETGRNVVRSSPAIGFDGTVYVGSVDSKVYALNGRTGKKKWEFVTGALVVASPTIGIDETVYIGSSDHKVYALDGRTGAKRWEFVTQEKVSSCPSIGIDGTLYVGSDDHKVYALLTESKGLAKSPWPMRGQNAQHTGRAPKADAFPAIAEVKPTEEALVNPNLKYKIEGDAVTITGCDKKVSGSLIIPATIEGKTVTSIGNEALRNCNSLTSITVPDSVTSIGEGAFFMSSNLTSITIGDGLTSIGDYTFSQCHSLTTIEVGAGNVNFTDVNGVLFNSEKTVLLTCPAGKTGATYNIPDGVTSIGNDAFSGCIRLTSITIPDSVTSIGEAAFRVCTRLTSIEIPDSVTSIGDFAFKDCTRLTSITIPDSVTSIGNFAFYECSNLTSITIPDSVTSIRKAAFSQCYKLTSITIADDVTSIGNDAFKDCTSLTSITIPNKVTSIGGHAFAGCTSLTTIEVEAGNVNFTEVRGVLLNAGKTVLLTYPAGKKGANYTIPDSVTSIEEGAFRECSSLTSITIPDSVTSIGEKVFYNCTSLNAVTFLGDAPKAGRSSPFFFANPTIYRKPEAKGWGDTFGYRPVKLISEKP